MTAVSVLRLFFSSCLIHVKCCLQNGNTSAQTPARRGPMRINVHKRANAASALSNTSRDSALGRVTPSSFHSESEFESDNEALRSTSRRSKRNRPVDPSRDLLVIHPRDDVSALLGISGPDLDEFVEMCNEGAEWGLVAQESKMKADDVYTPLVSTISSSSFVSGKDLGRRIKKLPPRIHADTSLRPHEVFERLKQPVTYFDYDLDSDDERLLSELSEYTNYASSGRSSKKAAVKAMSGAAIEPLTKSQLEIIFNVLEREMEIARLFYKQIDLMRMQYSKLIATMKEMKEVLAALAAVDTASINRSRIAAEAPRRAVRRSTTAKKQKRAASKIEEPYGSRIINEALEICDRHIALAQSTMNSSAVVNADIVAVCSSVATPDAYAASASKRRGRPPLHSKPAELTALAVVGTPAVTKGAPKDDDDPEYNLPPFYSEAELREMVPWSVAEAAIRAVLPHLFNKIASQKSSKKTLELLEDCGFLTSESSQLTCRAADTHLVMSPVYRVYEHWLSRRSSRRTSFLRGFHVFLMENWKASSALGTSVAAVTREGLIVQLTESRKRLLRLRVDLDRARLIMDLVRKREKMKKMIFRNTSESFDEAFAEEPEYDAIKETKKRKKAVPVMNGVHNVLSFYQGASSEGESFDDYSDCTDDHANSSSEGEDSVKISTPTVKRSRSGAVIGGDNLARLAVKSPVLMSNGNCINSKRKQSTLVDEPVLARLSQPMKTPMRSQSSESAAFANASKHSDLPVSTNKVAFPCSLQNASMTKLASSSSLSSSGSSAEADDALHSVKVESRLSNRSLSGKPKVTSSSAPEQESKKSVDTLNRSLRSDKESMSKIAPASSAASPRMKRHRAEETFSADIKGIVDANSAKKINSVGIFKQEGGRATRSSSGNNHHVIVKK